MPLTLPQLDDRRYADLVEEARTLIPTYAPEWTNHNESDPGITLVEMFAFLTEMLLYRLNRVTDENLTTFLRLLNGPDWSPQLPLRDEIREAVQALRRPERAVTCADFERLAREADARVARARCLPRRNLDSENPLAPNVDKPGHTSVLIVPADVEQHPQPAPDLIAAVRAYLEPRRLLTNTVHVVGPQYAQVGVRLTLVLKPDAAEEAVRTQAVAALLAFLHPLRGGPDGAGWPFGRNVHVSEIYALLDGLAGVDYVTRTHDDNANVWLDELRADPSRLIRNDAGELIEVAVGPDELVSATVAPSDLQTIRPRMSLR